MVALFIGLVTAEQALIVPTLRVVTQPPTLRVPRPAANQIIRSTQQHQPGSTNCPLPLAFEAPPPFQIKG
jgi:hypothetical protein